MQFIVPFVVFLSLPSLVLNAASAKTDPNQIGTRDVGTGLNIYSRRSEIDWGRRRAHDLELQVKILDDPVTGEYVNRIGQSLARNSDARTVLVIKVIQSEQINAFALPGGFVATSPPVSFGWQMTRRNLQVRLRTRSATWLPDMQHAGKREISYRFRWSCSAVFPASPIAWRS